MLVIDSHLDLAWNALNWNRDLCKPIDEVRRTEAAMDEVRRGANTVCFPEMRRGEVAVCLATILARSTTLNEVYLDYRSQEIASAAAHGQLAYYRNMEGCGLLRQLRNWTDLESHIKDWTSRTTARIGYILSMEGADPILAPSDAMNWWEKGLRVVGLSHYGEGVYAHGTSSPGGLTTKGFALLKALEERNMILDVAHLTDKGFWEAFDRFHGSVLASHCNCRTLVPGDRQLSDEQLRMLIARGSVIGIALDSWMLRPDYVPGKTDNNLVILQSAVDHIDFICQLAGDSRFVGIGSDLDGGFGKEQAPSDLETIADLQKIPPLLEKKGYTETDIKGILHGNWLDFFRKAWANLNH